MNMAGKGLSPNWRALYEAAILELELDKLPMRIAEAERAVTGRLQEMNRTDDGVESEALMNALNVLRDLRKMAADQGE